jgi:hypothetical protein
MGVYAYYGKVIDFWDIAPCSLVVDPHFRVRNSSIIRAMNMGKLYYTEELHFRLVQDGILYYQKSNQYPYYTSHSFYIICPQILV